MKLTHLPDVRDGLNTIDRQTLYTLYQADPDKALVRLAEVQHPLVESLGAARFAELMLGDIHFLRIYYESEGVFPTRIPNLLINGASSPETNIPPHNLSEIIDATIAMVENPAIMLEEIMQYVPGPDFPTGGFIVGRDGIREAYQTGRGSLKMRARTVIEKIGKDREAIVITEIPYQIDNTELVEQIAGLMGKKIKGISGVYDEGNNGIVIELKRGEQAEVVLNNLYKHRELQIYFDVVMLAIVDGQPRELGLVEVLRHFVNHYIDVVRRRTDYLLHRARAREHVLIGFREAFRNMGKVTTIIRHSKIASEELVKRLGFTKQQAEAIMELTSEDITEADRHEILCELAEIQRKISEYREILSSEEKIREVIVRELKEVKKEFGNARRTRIVDDRSR